MANKIPQWELNQQDLQLIDMAFTEDLGEPYYDVTTSILFVNSNQSTTVATIISKHHEPLIVCGLPVAAAILAKTGHAYDIHSNMQDGDILDPGSTLLRLQGPANELLSVERIMLNFLQRLCAIATLTRKYVDKIKHTTTKVLDTRKTLPGFRHLEKYAVHCGGGVNHRMGLYDALMIKDTHIDSLGGMKMALEMLPERIMDKYPVIVEVRNIDELEIVLEKGMHKVSRVLLDNMSLEQTIECVSICKNKIITESSGNIHLENILSVAQCGVDFISVGKITHSAGSVDLSMKCEN